MDSIHFSSLHYEKYSPQPAGRSLVRRLEWRPGENSKETQKIIYAIPH